MSRVAVVPPPEAFTTARGIAIHMAGHAVMARIISQPFMPTRVVDTAASYDELDHGLPAWFAHDGSSTVLGQVTLSKRVMVCLAGAAAEAAWLDGCAHAPTDVTEVHELGVAKDQLAARSVAATAHSGTAVTEAYIEYIRQLVLTRTGSAFFQRPASGDIRALDMTLRRAFWLNVYGVADAVERARQLSWAKDKDRDEPAPKGRPRAAAWDPAFTLASR